MNELIKINYDSDRPTVLGRDLYEALEIETRYNDWFKRMSEYGFTEGIDFYSILSKTTEGGRPRQDHQLTIEMAKEICMLQRNEKGKMFRRYFIQVEESWNSPEMIMKRALDIANSRVKDLMKINSELTEDVERMRPKEIFADAVSVSDDCILVGELAKLLHQNGVNIGQNRLFEWLRENGFLIKRKGKDYNIPTQKAMEMGLFKIREITVTRSSGQTDIKKTAKVTGKGQVYFINKFKKIFNV